MGWLLSLAQLARRFRGPAAVFAFCIIALALIITWLFGQNSFSKLLENSSSLSSREVLFVVTMVLLSVVGIIILVIVLTYRERTPKRAAMNLFFTAHDSSDPSAVIVGAEIRLMLREPVTKKTDENGTAVFVVAAEYAKQSLFVNAAAEGYSARNSMKIKPDDSDHILLPLTKPRGEPVTLQSASEIEAVKSILQGCYKRAVYTRTHAQMSHRAMFDVIGKCRAIVQEKVPSIASPDLAQHAANLIASLYAIEREEAKEPLDCARIDSFKLETLKGLSFLSRLTKIPYVVPQNLTEEVFFSMKEAEMAPTMRKLPDAP
jgi:hypothetical protein